MWDLGLYSCRLAGACCTPTLHPEACARTALAQPLALCPQPIIGRLSRTICCPQVVLAEKQQCPFTNQPLQFEQLKVRAGRGCWWC